MAAFGIVQTTNNNTVSSNSSHAVSMPSGITAGDRLIVFSTFDTSGAITVPGTWTTVSNTTNGAGLRFIVATLVAVGSDTLTYTSGAGVTSAHAAFRCYSNDTTIRNGTAATGTSTSPNPPNLDNTTSQKFLWFAAAGSATAFSAYPSNYSSNQVSAGTGNAYVRVATRNLEASSEDPGTFTTTSGVWVAQTLSLDEQTTVVGNFPIITETSTIFQPAIDFAADATFPIITQTSTIFAPTAYADQSANWTNESRNTTTWTNL